MTTAKHTNIGRFFGVYLLCSESVEKRYKGKCYIGFTVNPNRRIKQHNRGKDFGGAKKTSDKGPWKMVMIVHGFPNNIAALQFEWAWQQPMLSSRLRMYAELKRKLPRETYFQYNFRILSRMLNVGPWCRLPLTVRWLEQEYKCDFDYDLLPPRHIQIISGAIIKEKGEILNNDNKTAAALLWSKECHLCMESITNPEFSRMGCLNATCKLTCHMICLANHMIASDLRNRGHLIPISGECPLCEAKLTWVALLQHQRKIQGRLSEEDIDNEEDEVELEIESSLSSDIASSDEETMSQIKGDIDHKSINLNYDNQFEIYEISD